MTILDALKMACPSVTDYNSDGRLLYADGADPAALATAQEVLTTYLGDPAAWATANAPEPWPTTLGWSLGIQAGDQNALNKMASIIATGRNVNAGDALAAFLATETTMKDSDGNPHTVTIAQAEQLLFGYGLYCQTLWAAGTLPL